MIYKYKQFTESFGKSNVDKELLEIGYNKEDLPELNKLVVSGELGKFLNSEDKNFTFGMLSAIYLDCIKLHKKHELKRGLAKAIVRAVPMLFSPISAVVSIVGQLFGGSRAIGKIVKPIIDDPGKSYPEFLKKFIRTSIKIAEGELSIDCILKPMAFVVSDKLVDMVDHKVLLKFTIYLSEKMSKEDKDKVVPDFYIENELRKYLNDNFSLDPPLKLKS
jgi:hypothetical protein